MTQVCAVIVAYNKLDLLKRSIGALRQTTHPLSEIIVVDNASTDGTGEWLRDQDDIRTLSMARNLGGAGGFHHGMAAAIEGDFDWIWLMDDDSIVEPEALSELIQATKENPLGSFFNSLVLWKDGAPCRMNIPKPVWEWTDIYVQGKQGVPLEACSFVSCLVNAKIARAVGLPIEEFFIWYDDFEYTARLSKIAPGYFVPQSRVTHETAFNKGVDWSEVSEKTIWKYRHGIRNELSLIATDQSYGHLKALLRLIECASLAGQGRPGWRVIMELWRSGLKGMFTNYRKFLRYAPTKNTIIQTLKFKEAHTPRTTFPGQNWAAVWGDDSRIMTHPPVLGSTPEENVYAEFPIPADTGNLYLEAVVSLTDSRAHPVVFHAEVRGKDGRVLSRQDVSVAYSDGYRLFQHQIDPIEAGAKLRLFTTMSENAPNFFFASAIWHHARLVRLG